jgi:hypothetical protein
MTLVSYLLLGGVLHCFPKEEDLEARRQRFADRRMNRTKGEIAR